MPDAESPTETYKQPDPNRSLADIIRAFHARGGRAAFLVEAAGGLAILTGLLKAIVDETQKGEGIPVATTKTDSSLSRGCLNSGTDALKYAMQLDLKGLTELNFGENRGLVSYEQMLADLSSSHAVCIGVDIAQADTYVRAQEMVGDLSRIRQVALVTDDLPDTLQEELDQINKVSSPQERERLLQQLFISNEKYTGYMEVKHLNDHLAQTRTALEQLIIHATRQNIPIFSAGVTDPNNPGGKRSEVISSAMRKAMDKQYGSCIPVFVGDRWLMYNDDKKFWNAMTWDRTRFQTEKIRTVRTDSNTITEIIQDKARQAGIRDVIVSSPTLTGVGYGGPRYMDWIPVQGDNPKPPDYWVVMHHHSPPLKDVHMNR